VDLAKTATTNVRKVPPQARRNAADVPTLSIRRPPIELPSANPSARAELAHVRPSVSCLDGTRRSASEKSEIRVGATAMPAMKEARSNAGTLLSIQAGNTTIT
jgi:hypothetical protein